MQFFLKKIKTYIELKIFVLPRKIIEFFIRGNAVFIL